MSRAARSIALLAALATAAAPLARLDAQPTSPVDRRTRAGELTEQGLAAYAAGDGARALAAFEAAYTLVPVDELLLNLGLAAELAGRPTAAIDYLERFLAVAPRDARAPEVSRRIASLREQLVAADTRRRAEDAARQAELDRAAQEALRRDREFRERQAHDQAAADEAAAVARREDALDRRGRGLRLGGLALGGGGLVALGAGAYFGLEARRLSDELSARHAQYDPAKVRAGEAADRNLVVALVAGGVLLGAGATLHVLGRRERERGRVVVAPTAGGLDVAWTGSF